ncbi:hypothetical protein LEMA_P028510.1 [Plenodomus lingam JN3]|uniref:C2H2-type domain-containing protein n=1 Tax=Leptosphaeria maculans (strain JN3 / isolate v23.1.3 / race Av1-4-5-6-7-8) TaxID=985895 RepID=E4ZVS3_LEPMJ|nr:hypothetical protein LEMA_P028510.1 [Plenodomus lingam JN3]CBX95699.1 hypothetical protein LEMA_P028510.1 [Plenodomus lingam JN3]
MIFSFEDAVAQPNIDPLQWNHQRQTSAQHLDVIASLPMHSTMTISSPSPYHHSSQFHHANLSPTSINNGSNMTPDIALLAPPSQYSQSSYDPIARQFQEQPWSVNNPRTSHPGGSRSPSTQPQMQYKMYRESGINAGCPDSAYYSQSQPAHSVLSNEPDCYNVELSPSVTFQIERMNVKSPATEAPPMARAHSALRSQGSSRSGKSGKLSKKIPCPNPECTTVSNCESEYKKHQLRHSKPFKCEEPNCKRHGEGFTTCNDLERHKKSVHCIGLGAGSFQCASEKCRNPYKIWPRLDNFKQHIERMHKEEDQIDLIKKSEYHPKEPQDRFESTTVASADTSFDVAGMERSLSANPVIDIAPAMDIAIVEHDHAQWSSWDRNAHNLAHQVSPNPAQHSGPLSRQGSIGTCRGQKQLPDQRKLGQGKAQPSLAVPERPSTKARSSATGQQNQQPSEFPELSNAPQTKAEQQRLALSKLSQAMFPSPSPVDLEALLVRMLHQAKDSASWENKAGKGQEESTRSDNDRGEFTKSDALHAVQAISNLIKQSRGTSSTKVQRRMAQGFVSDAKVCPFLKCGFAVARNCDLRKHMKRHERPYGCTYPKCYKRFGAKSDYKRHENSQHPQLEAWRCSQVDGIDQHKELSAEEIQGHLVKDRMAKNGQERFWCGFCNAMIELQQKRNAAWNERFDHIVDHFDKEKRSIHDWICVEENKTKKELRESKTLKTWHSIHCKTYCK